MKLKNKHHQKSKYYTAAEGYRDIDGNQKQFTFVDHDVKLKITIGKESETAKLWTELRHSIDFSSPKVIEHCNLFWNSSYSELTEEILGEEYLPLHLLQELIKYGTRRI